MKKLALSLVIAGQGKLAGAIFQSCQGDNVTSWHYEYGMELPKGCNRTNTVAVHAGSGRQLRRFVKFCSENGLVLIQASGGMEKRLPKKPKIPIVNAPNSSPTIVGFLQVLPNILGQLAEHGIVPRGLEETHQASKETVPATALEMAAVMGLKPESIRSVRSNSEALGMGVESKHLAGHGHHFMYFRGADGVDIEFVTRVNGRDPYGKGLISIARACLVLAAADRLSLRYYTIAETQWLIRAYPRRVS